MAPAFFVFVCASTSSCLDDDIKGLEPYPEAGPSDAAADRAADRADVGTANGEASASDEDASAPTADAGQQELDDAHAGDVAGDAVGQDDAEAQESGAGSDL